MKNKSEKQIDEMWREHIDSRTAPTPDELCKQAVEELYGTQPTVPKTNFQMYNEIKLLHENNGILDYETINKVFNLENRTELDLKNLSDFIKIVTSMSAQEMLNAKLNKNSEEVHLEIKKYAKRCALMVILTEAITSALC